MCLCEVVWSGAELWDPHRWLIPRESGAPISGPSQKYSHTKQGGGQSGLLAHLMDEKLKHKEKPGLFRKGRRNKIF